MSSSFSSSEVLCCGLSRSSWIVHCVLLSKKSKENRATPRRQDFLFYAIEINNLINLSASTTTLKN